ncbi:MAG: phospho-N-acetylmuramoyl-pentapeptide-transferase [Clostridia bacterium]|nr:phospho-N-acetylmuramoyl-pentapeptide-transferase [Clostridia bacterium]
MKLGWLVRALCALLSSFFVALLLSPCVLRLAKRLKAGQPILCYVKQHAAKAGTPTFGGFIFLLSTLFATMAFCFHEKIGVGLIACFVMLSYAVLGFLDDFIKIKTKDNMGLRPYQKVVGQAAIALIVALFAYRSKEIGPAVYFPFYGKAVDFGVWYVPFACFIYLALSNCVNLTDGLDGLATGCSLSYLFTFAVVLSLCVVKNAVAPSLLTFCAALIGGLLAFYLFNANKAAIFMGDTGSLGLGGALAAIALFSKQPFLVPVVGIMFVLSGISIIVQVCYFKVTHGKRVFLMAPFHHHLEKKGWGEAKICALYSVLSAVMGVVAILSVIVGQYG